MLLAQLGSGLCWFKTISGPQTSLVVTWVPQLSVLVANGSFLTACMGCWAAPKPQASVHTPVSPAPLCSITYLPRLSWPSAFQQSDEPVKYSNINLPASSRSPAARRGWRWRTGDQQARVSAAPGTPTHPSSLRPAAKCAMKTATSPTQRGMGEFNGCYWLIKGSQWGWLRADWSQWKALP